MMGDIDLAKINIAIDGPAGAGKSTIAKYISKTLGIVYLDTGAMYRAVALKAIKCGINTKDADRLAELVKDIDIKIFYSGDEQHILLDGEDVSSEIRTPEVSIGSSNVAVIPAVRIKLVDLQRKIALFDDVVMDGRDIGTFVLPEARYKFFLTASIDERAKRRYNEQLAKGIKEIALEDVKKDIEYRDKNDSTRDFAPLSKAHDAIEIDTTNMTIIEVAEKILSHIYELKK
jgi:CMP/dCMP kinase